MRDQHAGRKKPNAAVAILDIGGMNDGMQQQTLRIYENVAPLLLPASGCFRHAVFDKGTANPLT